MKVYVRAAKTIEQLRQQDAPGMDPDVFKELVEVDPTANFDQGKGGKYCPWIIRQYKSGNLKENDFANLRDALMLFGKQGKKFNSADINQYKDVTPFLEEANDVLNRPLTEKEKQKIAKKQSKQKSDSDRRLLIDDGEWEVWQPLTWSGSISLAYEGVKKGEPCDSSHPDNMKATWCTAGESSDHYFNYYTSQGPLFIFIPKNDPINKFQACFAANSWWYDKYDDEHGQGAWIQFCQEHPKIGEFFETKSIDGVDMMAGNIIGFTDGATTIKIPEDTVTVSKRFPNSVEEVYMPSSVTSLCNRIFEGCSKLKKITLSEGLTVIPNQAFVNCTALAELAIPDSVTEYGDSAFEGCTALTSFKNSASVTKVGNRCFAKCAKLDDFELPNTVTDLGNGCFDGVGFTGITLPTALTKLKGTFTNDTAIRTVDLQNVTEISANAFRSSAIENIDLTKVTKIGSNAFRQCNNLVDVELNPEGVHLESSVFSDNPNLASINVPAGSSLGLVVFDNCPNLTVTWEDEDAPYEFDNIKLLICPDSCTELIDANKGYVRIQTTSGKVYDVDG